MKISPAKLACTLLSLALVTAFPAVAGLHYEARTWQEGAQASKAANQRVEAWVDGDNAKIQFVESKNAMTPEGSHVLTTDGGVTIYLVNPKEETYSEWDLEALMETMSQVMEGMGGMFDIEISDPVVELLLEEDGGSFAGFSTTHHRFRTSYSMKMKIMGMKRASEIVSVSDIWSTNEIKDKAMGVWLRRDPPDMGDTGLDKLIAAEMSKIKGFPMKTIEEQTSTNKKGKESVTRTFTEVHTVEKVSVDPDLFVIPDHYTETEMMAGLEDEEGGGNPLSGMFGGKKKKD